MLTKKTRPAIAFLTHSIADDYGALVWKSVRDAARGGDANLICFPGWAINDIRGFNKQANIIYELVSAKIVDGLILSSGVLSNYLGLEGLEQFCANYPMPKASIAVELNGIPSVLVDNRKSMQAVMSHLIEVHGLHRIAYISGPEGNVEAQMRYQGYKDGLAAHNLPLDPSLASPSTNWDYASGMEAMRFLLDERNLKPGVDFQAVVTSSDNVLVGAMSEIQTRGIRVPKDIAVTGFDDEERIRYLTPPLTAVRNPIREEARQATKIVLAQIRGEPVPERMELPTDLIIRQSCGCSNPAVVMARAGLATKASKIPKMALAARRESILSEIEKTLTESSGDTVQKHAEQLLNALYAELKGESGGTFLSTLDETLSQVARLNSDMAIWQEVISILRRNILPYIDDDQVRSHVEDLWHQARVIIGERAQREMGYRRLQAEQRTAVLDGISQALVSTSDEKELMTILADGLPKLGIPNCYVSRYENPVVPIEWCKNILAFKDGQRVEVEKDKRRFPSCQLVPLDMLPQDRPYSLVVEPLYFQKNQIGIAVFEARLNEGTIYETLRGQLSSALWAQRLGEYLRSLYEASSKIMAFREPGEVLQETVKKVCQAVGAKAASVVIPDKDGRQRRLATGGDFDNTQHSSVLVGTASMVAEVMRSDQPNLIEDLHKQANPAVQRMIELGIEAAGCFPLRLGDKPIGVMWIFYEKPHHFPNAEINALRLYVNQAAIAYDNARRTKELTHLRQAAEKLAQAAEVKQVLQQIVVSARDVFEADSAVIWSFDASQHVFLPDELVADGVTPGVLEKFRKDVPRREGRAAIVMQRGYLAVTDVLAPEYDYLKAPTPRLRHAIGVKSFQGIALQVEGEPLGVLYVNHKEPRGFDNEDETTLRTFAYDAALALKKARLLEQVQRTNNTARTVAEAIVLAELQDTLNAVAEGAQKALPCDAVVLFVYDRRTDKLQHPPVMSSGVQHPERASNQEEVLRESLVYKMLAQDQPYIVEVEAQDPLFANARFGKDEEIESCVAIPLLAADQRVGVMFVNFRTQHHFTSSELSHIELFAYQAAAAIHITQLYDEAKKKTAYWEALYDAGNAVSGTLALQDILDHITEQAQLITGRTRGPKARFSYLALVEGNKLKMMSAFPTDYLQELQRTADNIDFEHDENIGITGRAVKSGESQLTNDAPKHPDYILGDPNTKSELAIPIKSGEKVIGVIDVECNDFGAFDEDDQQALEALAAQAAIAIRNAQQYEELTRTKGMVGARTALAWMGMASSAWRHTIDKHVLSIAEQADLLNKDLIGMVPADRNPRLYERLTMIQRLARQIKEKPITPPLSIEEGVVSLSLNGLIRERIRQLTENEPYKSVTFELKLAIDDRRTVRASPEWLRRALDLLIDNGIEAMTDPLRRKLIIETSQHDSQMVLRISDTGKGIPDDVIMVLFGDQIHKPEGSKGLGMGLLMAQAIIQTYGGEIRVEATDPTGTTMLIRLPLECS